jgi:energy-coupling factor transporter ATP-binding protein EcfA2
VVGPARSGNSTLLAALAGLLPVSAGTIERRGTVALAMQHAEFARATPRDCLAVALSHARVPPQRRAERIVDALAAMKIGQLIDQPVAYLTPAQRRRVHLAGALALRADAVLLDEPFAGLDAEARAELIAHTRTALDTAIIAVGDPVRIGDRVVHLDREST